MNGLLVLLLIAGSLYGQQPRTNWPEDDSVGLDQVVQTLLSAFDRTDIVALSDTHGDRLDSELRIRLIRHPQFARKVHFIAVEFGSTAQQTVLDRYIAGGQVPTDQLTAIWRTTTQTNGVWDSPVYAEFFRTVSEVNETLPAELKIRVLAGDPPRDSTVDRDVSAIDVLKEEVLSRHA